MAFDVLPGLGQPQRRVEDSRLLIGQGRFTANLAATGALHVVFLRSPHAHARLVRVDAAVARAMPGVATIFGAEDTASLGPIPPINEIFDPTGRRHIHPPRHPMPRDRVRHVGEIVAMVAAETLDQARDAAEAVMVEYDPLPALVLPEQALAPGAPSIHAEAPGNLLCDWRRGDAAAVAAAVAAAAHVTRLTLRSPRIVAGYLETRSALAAWRDGAVTLTTPSQGVHVLHRVLCDHVLRWPREKLRVVTHDVGGGFGPKLTPYPEQALLCLAAERLRRDLRWVQERSEHHLADTQARDLLAEVTLALDEAGRFTAIGVEAIANFGAWVSPVAPTIPTVGMAKVLTGLYAIPAAHIRMRCAFTNTVPVDAIRGAGKPETFVLLERAVDQAARETGRDPVALRRLNLLPPGAFPHRTPLGHEYDSGDYPALLDAALLAAGDEGFPVRRAASAARGLRRGRGVSCHLHGSGGWGDETSDVEVLADGSIVARTGTQSQGQGHATAFAQLLAAGFGVPIERVRIVQGDSAAHPRGGGTGGSSSMIVSGTGMRLAAKAAIEAGREHAGRLLEAATVDIEWERDAYVVAGTDRRVGLAEVAEAAGGLRGRADFADTVASWPAGVAIAEVEIDPETGAVRLDRFVSSVDAGNVVNPMLLAGQLHGGFAAGIGGALLEAVRHDADGQLLSATLMDYAMPRADDLPAFAQVMVPVPTPNNALGIKGVGELPTNGAPAAVANAVADALGGVGVALPMTPAAIWEALRASAT